MTYTWEEADMTLAMRLQGRSLQQIQTALDTVRRNRTAFRNNAGIAFSSQALSDVQGRWLGPPTTSAEVPEQVAIQLRGRHLQMLMSFGARFGQQSRAVILHHNSIVATYI